MKKAILVGLNIDNNEFFEEEMKELKGLAKADDYKVVSSLTQNSKSINKKFFIGNGKVETLKLLVNEYEADVVIFNDELSPLQYKNLEDEKYKDIQELRNRLKEIENLSTKEEQESKQALDYFDLIIENEKIDKAILNMLIDKIYIYHDKSVEIKLKIDINKLL